MVTGFGSLEVPSAFTFLFISLGPRLSRQELSSCHLAGIHTIVPSFRCTDADQKIATHSL